MLIFAMVIFNFWSPVEITQEILFGFHNLFGNPQNQWMNHNFIGFETCFELDCSRCFPFVFWRFVHFWKDFVRVIIFNMRIHIFFNWFVFIFGWFRFVFLGWFRFVFLRWFRFVFWFATSVIFGWLRFVLWLRWFRLVFFRWFRFVLWLRWFRFVLWLRWFRLVFFRWLRFVLWLYIVRLKIISRLDIEIKKLFFAISTRGRAISTLIYHWHATFHFRFGCISCRRRRFAQLYHQANAYQNQNLILFEHHEVPEAVEWNTVSFAVLILRRSSLKTDSH